MQLWGDEDEGQAMIVDLGERRVGDGQPALLVTELGINHNGSVETAVQMVRAAVEAGADAVKVQAFDSASFCTEAAMWQGESQLEMFRRYELGAVQLAEVAHECRRLGVMFFGTPDSARKAEVMLALGAPCLKVGSDDLVHLPLLRQLAHYRVPLILSTGMADQLEIDDATDAVGSTPVILMHCVSSYPTPVKDANLGRLAAMRRRYGIAGYSDHTADITAAVGAAWLGACIIEKHFTLDRNMSGPDHYFSATPAHFNAMAIQIRQAEDMLGDGEIDSTADVGMRVIARRSIVAAQSLDAGVKIASSMLAYKRPGDGLPPRMADELVGKTLTRAVVADEQIREGDWK
jgi:N-acetylneuraminate synthase/N,N'-diacetyllegionaminate synthase